MLNILLDNWFFAIIILWLIFGMLGRGNRDKTQSEQHQLPDAERRQLERQQDILRTETDREEVKRKLSDTVRETARDIRHRVEEMEQQWQRQQEQSLPSKSPRDAQILDSINTVTEPEHAYERGDSPYEREVKQPYARRNKEPYQPSVSKRYAAFEMSTDRSSLKQGIVWAEVLGQPRAKSPYRPPRLKGR